MGTTKEHDHRAYVEAIRARHARAEQRKEFGKNLVNKAKGFLGKTSATKEPVKALSQSAYITAKRQTTKGTDIITPPRPTPANSYIQEKRAASLNYQYTSQRQKIRAPYPTR